MWPFKKKHTAEYKLPELKEIRFSGWRYTPQADITSHEVALMLPMFLSPYWQIDYHGYIEKNKLDRHFTKVIKEENNAS